MVCAFIPSCRLRWQVTTPLSVARRLCQPRFPASATDPAKRPCWPTLSFRAPTACWCPARAPARSAHHRPGHDARTRAGQAPGLRYQGVFLVVDTQAGGLAASRRKTTVTPVRHTDPSSHTPWTRPNVPCQYPPHSRNYKTKQTYLVTYLVTGAHRAVCYNSASNAVS